MIFLYKSIIFNILCSFECFLQFSFCIRSVLDFDIIFIQVIINFQFAIIG